MTEQTTTSMADGIHFHGAERAFTCACQRQVSRGRAAAIVVDRVGAACVCFACAQALHGVRPWMAVTFHAN